MLEPTVECRAVKATVTALIDDLLKMYSYIGLENSFLSFYYCLMAYSSWMRIRRACVFLFVCRDMFLRCMFLFWPESLNM